MPLPIRDGNQSLTTLSTLIVNSAHVPAHTVVSLGSQAITDIAQAVSGVELGQNTLNALENITVTMGQVTVTGGLTNAELRASSVTVGGSVQVSNFPATQTVTFGQAVVSASNIGDILSSVGTDNTADATTKFFKIGGHQSGSNQTSHIVHVSAGGSMSVDASGSSVTFTQASVTFSSITGSVSVLNLPATQTVTFTQASVTFGTPVVTGSVSVLNFPSTQTVAGTVTAYAVGKYAVGGPVFQDKNIATDVNGQTLINATVNAQSVFSYDGESHIFAKLTPNTTVTIGSLPAISGAVTANPPSYNLNFTTVTSVTFASSGNSGRIILNSQQAGQTLAFTGNFAGGTNNVYSLQAGGWGGGPNLLNPVTVSVIDANSFVSAVTFAASGPFNTWLFQASTAGNDYQFVKQSGIAGANISTTFSLVNIPNYGFERNTPIVGTVTARLQDASGNNLTSTTIGGSARLNVTLASATTTGVALPAVINVYGGSDGGTVRAVALDSSGRSVVTVSNFPATQPVSIASVTIGNSITIGSLPAISGTVTANGVEAQIQDALFGNDHLVNNLNQYLVLQNNVPISGTVTVGNTVAISGTVTANPTGTQTIAGTVTVSAISTSVTARLVDSTGTAVSYAATGSAGTPSTDVISVQGVSGGTSLPISGTAGTLTTRFGSVTTANTAQISSAVTNTSRKYLLIQNVTTSSNVITIGVGFTPTTTQGIQLTAGAGITFESSYIPTGAVYVLSSVTASPFTILEA